MVLKKISLRITLEDNASAYTLSSTQISVGAGAHRQESGVKAVGRILLIDL